MDRPPDENTILVALLEHKPKQRVCVHIHVVAGQVSQIMVVLEIDNTVNQLMSERHRQADRKFRLSELLWRHVQLMPYEESEA